MGVGVIADGTLPPPPKNHAYTPPPTIAAPTSQPQVRVEQVCKQLQDDIQKMKGHKAAVMRRMEQREREFREWRTARERELAQLRRSAQRQNAALQQHQAMHIKQQVRGEAMQYGCATNVYTYAHLCGCVNACLHACAVGVCVVSVVCALCVLCMRGMCVDVGRA